MSTRHGYTEPAAIEDAGALTDWRGVMDRSAELVPPSLRKAIGDIAGYGVAMAYRVRFYMQMNARGSHARHRAPFSATRVIPPTVVCASSCIARSPTSPVIGRSPTP